MKKVKIATFLKERKIKLKPDEANNSNLKRIEKIDFAGNITIAPTTTKTDMILVKKGDLVISGINVEKGALTIYQGEEDVLASIHYSAYEFDETQIYILYLKYFLKSREFRKLLIEQSGSGIKNEIKAKHILPLEIKLPSIQEQYRIVERIQAVENDIVELNKEVMQQYEDCKNLRQSILQQAVEGKLCEQNSDDEPASVLLEKIKKEKDKLVREGKIKKPKELPPISDEEKPFELPKGWKWCRLGEVLFDIKYGSSKKLGYNQTEIPVLRIPNINLKNSTLDFADIKYADLSKEEIKRYGLKRGDVLLIRSNGSASIVGRIALVGDMQKNICYAGYLMRMRLFEEAINNTFIKLIFNCCFIRKQIEIPIRTTTGVKNINSTEVEKLLIPLPPLNEQQRIVEKVDRLMLLCDELEKEVNAAQQYASQLMESVLQEAFSTDKPIAEEQSKQKCKVIPIQPKQETELHFAMAARGNIKQSTLESLQKRAIEIANGEK